MRCKKCKRELPENAIFCCWCGVRQIEEAKEIKVPKPRQLPSGTWTAQMMIKGKRCSITADSEEEYYVKARAAKTGLVALSKRSESITLETACRRYIDDARGRLRPSTVQGYEKIVEQNFQTLMHTRLDKINEKALQRAVDDECKKVSRRGKPYSPKTIANGYMFIATVLHEVMPDLDTTVRLPEEKRKPVQILTPEEVYSAVQGTEIELPVLLSMWLSFSMSELLGLSKSKSIRGNQISVVDTVTTVRGEAVRSEGGKEELRSRTLTMPSYIASLIDDVPGDVIVPMTAQTLSKRFYRALDKAGLPHMTFHQLRHINASVMSRLGIPDVDANERGGWKTDYVRKTVYTHAFTEQRQQSDLTVDSFFTNIITNADNKS